MGRLVLRSKHRLLCGDCRDPAAWERLLGGERVNAIVTDPPYGIDYESGMEGHLPRSIEGDETTESRDWVLSKFGDEFPIACFATWRCVSPRKQKGQLIWKKNVGGMGDLSFPWSCDYEVIWIFGNGWEGHRGSSVLEGETICTWNTGPARRHHPHQKPVAVLAEIVGKIKGIIADPFVGSGTTIMACEALGRRCFACEIEPAYVDVSIRRWQAKTGEQARLESTGETFAELEAANG